MGSTAGSRSLFLSRNDLGINRPKQRRQHRFRNPLQPRIVGKRFLPHEPVKFGKCDGVAEERGVFLPQSGERRQIGVFRRRSVPPCPDLRERMLGRRSPENVLASVVVCDERMLQAKPICNRANARPFKSSFGELGNGSVQDRASRLERALLFGPLARTPPPLHGRFQLCASSPCSLANTIAGETPGASCADGYRGDLSLLAATKLRRPSAPGCKLPGKPEVIFDGVDAVLQLGTNNERRLDAKNRIASPDIHRLRRTDE